MIAGYRDDNRRFEVDGLKTQPIEGSYKLYTKLVSIWHECNY